MNRQRSEEQVSTESRIPLSRRQFLGMSAGAAALLGAGTAASQIGANAAAGAAAVAHKPRRGGTLTAGLTGGDSSDTLDGQQGVNNVDFARIRSLYNALVAFNDQAEVEYDLAESITPNHDATEWTIHLRRGVEFHNGKEFTAEDVIYSLKRVANPKSPLPAASSIALCDVPNLKALDKYTVLVPCHKPYATFVEAIVGYYYYLSIVPVGYDPKKPVGTGPFKYEKFSPGVQSTFSRNPNYFRSGQPYVDKLVISDYSDETGQVNGLTGGQVDLVNLLSAPSIRAVESSGAKILISDSGGFTPFTMRVDVAPFNDVNLRKALRLVVNRPEMLKLVFAGHGRVANDIFSPYDPNYDSGIPQRVQDIDEAKHYLKKAGLYGKSVTLTTAPLAQGTSLAATVLAQQASLANLKVNLQTVNVTEFYGTNYLKWAFGQDYWYYSDYLPQVAQATLPSSPFNETHWDDGAYNKLYASAISTLDASKRREIVHEMQMIDHSIGGYIIPYFPPVIDGYSSRVHGLHPCRTGLSLSNYGFGSMWIS